MCLLPASCVFLANYVSKCQMSLGPYGPIFTNYMYAVETTQRYTKMNTSSFVEFCRNRFWLTNLLTKCTIL